MEKLAIEYLATLGQSVYNQISLNINARTIDRVVKIDLVRSHVDEKVSASFQKYYFQTLDNADLFLQSSNFFRHFKRRYSLQGIDNNFLDKLETQKTEILSLIRSDKLTQLYFKTFNKAAIKHGEFFKEKDLGSFFAKIVHTFRPFDYCALDNPIKSFFKLKRESFFIAFWTISQQYDQWSNNHKELIREIRDNFKSLDYEGIINHDLLTDMKLLDLIFWTKANRPSWNAPEGFTALGPP